MERIEKIEKMPESFESKIQRVGFLVKKDDLGRIIVKPSNSKILSGIILSIFGLILIPLAVDPIIILSNNSDSLLNFSLSTIINVSKLGLSAFGMVIFYRGVFRLFEYVGFELTIKPKEVQVKQRKDIKIQLFTITHPLAFECHLDNKNYVIISCDHENGTTELIKEKNDISDCFPILKQLTDRFREVLS